MKGLAMLVALILSAGEGRAQTTAVTVRDGVTRADDFHAALRPAEALESLRGALQSDSTRFDALWRASRETVNLGMLAADDDEARAWYAASVDFAERAVRSAPDSANGYQWLSIALGRLALSEGPKTRVRLAVQVRENALLAVQIDSTAAGAHNVLGEWHAEIQRLGGLTRFAAERILGADTFRLASWEEAVHHLNRAIELEPDALIHRLALARVYLDLGQQADARTQLIVAIELPTLQPTDPASRREAEALLRRIR
jgi:tetratricopeptide (TPR) repeat protein